MIVLVNDASILIDLLKMDFLNAFSRLRYELHVTDFVLAEVQEENIDQLDACIRNGRLVKKTFSFQELARIQWLGTTYRGLSVPDCSCLFLVQELSATLLTGDAALRAIARQNRIPVHGLLWVLDELVEQTLITPKIAYKKLERAMSINRRLPVDECNKRLLKWKKGDR